MGMFDNIEDIQVKCFTVPLFTVEGDAFYSGGSLKAYKIGDEVPYKAEHYDYGKNFNIISADTDRNKVIAVRDGKVYTIRDADISYGLWYECRKCISDFGEELNVSSKKECLEYLQALSRMNAEIIRYRNENMQALKEKRKLEREMLNAGRSEEDMKHYADLCKEANEELKEFQDFRNAITKQFKDRYMMLKGSTGKPKTAAEEAHC